MALRSCWILRTGFSRTTFWSIPWFPCFSLAVSLFAPESPIKTHKGPTMLTRRCQSVHVLVAKQFQGLWGRILALQVDKCTNCPRRGDRGSASAVWASKSSNLSLIIGQVSIAYINAWNRIHGVSDCHCDDVSLRGAETC